MSGETTVPPQTKRIGVRELRGDLSGFLRQVANGESFLVTSHDTVVAVLGPPPQASCAPRRLGALKGQIWMADDFDEWPPDILDHFQSDL